MGLPIVQGEGATELAAFEQLWTNFMQANQVPAVALAVARNGKLLLAKSYTLDAKEPVALQLSPFRLASCSKLITTIAIHQLLEKGSEFTPAFTLDSKVSEILKDLPEPKKKILGNLVIPDKDLPINSTRWATVTVRDLLTMKSGLRHGFADLDPFVCKAYLHSLPANNKGEIIRYALTFDDEPGGDPYRNFDFFVLTAIIEKLTGMDYVLAVRKSILEPLGLVRPQAAGSLEKDRVPYELSYHPVNAGQAPNVMSDNPPSVPNGQGNVNLEVGVGVGGWLMTAMDYAKILSIFDSGFENRLFKHHNTVEQMFSIPDPGPPILGLGWSVQQWGPTTSFEWGGVLPGVRSYTSRREDGVCIVSVFNTDTGAADKAWNPNLLKGMHATLDNISTWPASSYDLFESVGIPAASSNRRWNSKPAVAEKGSGWHGWFDLGARLDGVSVTTVHPGFYDVYARGLGERLWQKWWDGKKWNPSETGWTLHDDGGFRLGSGPAATSLGDSFRDVYARGKDGAVYHKSWNGKEWRRWFSLGGNILGPPGVVAIRADLRDIYARGTNDHLFQKWWDGQKWNPSNDGWTEHQDGDFRLGSAPAVIANGDNFRDVYVRGQDGAVYRKFWDGEKWSGWFGLGGKIIGQPAVVFIPPNSIDIYVRWVDNRLWQKWWDGEKWNPSDTGWLPHNDSGFQMMGSPSVISDGPNHRGVFARGPESVLYYKFWQA